MRHYPLRILLVSLAVAAVVAEAALVPPVLAPNGSSSLHTPALVTITHSNPAGAIFYTTDGSDPRNVFGGVAPAARLYQAALTINRSTVIRTRVKEHTEWSALTTGVYIADQDFSKLLFTEVMFHPRNTSDLEEFVELKNVGNAWLNLSGLELGVEYFSHTPLPLNTRIAPGGFLVIARSESIFHFTYPGAPLHGIFSGAYSNSYDRLSIRTSNRVEAAFMVYDTAAPWQVVPDNHGYFLDDGTGFSLARVNYNTSADPAHPSTWRASRSRFGSPGRDDPAPTVPPVYINELLTRSATGARDAVEFFNPNAFPVDIGGWWLSDERNDPHRYRIPPATIVPAGEYLVMDDSLFGTGPIPVGFATEGERCYLFSADANGELTGYSHGLQFYGSDPDVTFGRYVTTDGEEYFPPQNAVTLGSVNAGPKIPPVVISEVMYRPLPGQPKYFEIRNTTDSPVSLWDPLNPLTGWQFIWNYSITIVPAGTTIPAQGHLIFAAEEAASFRVRYNVPLDVPIITIPDSPDYPFSPHFLEVQRPSGRTNGIPRYIEVDQVWFRDYAPWPNGVAPGYAIERIRNDAFGNEPTNWRVSPTRHSPGVANTGNVPPTVWAGADRTEFVGSSVALGGVVADDRWSGAAPTTSWVQIGGPAPVQFSAASNPESTAIFPAPGTYILQLDVTDGGPVVSDTVSISVAPRPFAAWQGSFFSPAELANPLVSGPQADPDRDGKPNVHEYLYGSNPRLSTQGGEPAARIANGKLQIRWRERNGITDLIVKPERAEAVQGPWDDTPEFFEITRVDLGAYTEVTATQRIPMLNRAFDYLRLRVMLR